MTLEPIVDLFLDLWIAPDGRFEVLDEDEFEEAAARGVLTEQQTDHARSILQWLIEATERGDFPPAAVKEFRNGSGTGTCLAERLKKGGGG